MRRPHRHLFRASYDCKRNPGHCFRTGSSRDFFARLHISRNRARYLFNPITWADAVAIVSFLAPLSSEAAGFLRILRTLRLLHTYQVLARLCADSPFFRRNEEVVLSVTHLSVLVSVMTPVVYETQHRTNPSPSLR